MDPYVWKRLWRRPWLSLCGMVFSGVLCFLLCFLAGYRQQQQAKLEQTQDTFEVRCIVSNRNGTRTDGLRMGITQYYFVTSPEYAVSAHVKDLQATKEFEAVWGELGISEARLVGVTHERCAEALDPAMGGSVTYLEDGFYEREEMLCLVSQECYQMLGEGNTVTLSVTDPYINPKYEPNLGKGKVELQVAGYYAGTGTEIYMPFPAAQSLCDRISQRRSCDSLAFLAKNNRELEALSEAASQRFSAVDPAADDSVMPNVAFTIHDEQYRATVAALEQNLARVRYLLPLVAALGLCVGFLISFLATRGERRTYALMRTLGMTRGKLFASILREQMLLPLMAVVGTALWTKQYVPAILYLLCDTIGCCAAILRSVRVAPTAILREQE